MEEIQEFNRGKKAKMGRLAITLSLGMVFMLQNRGSNTPMADRPLLT